MKKLFLLALLFGVFIKQVSAQGITFAEGSWAEVVALAKQANKPIFIDVYTAWCGPCKVMAKNIFPQKEVGDKFNTGFINYKFDAEKGEGVELAKKYEVRAYPTFLMVDPKNLALIHKEVGALSINDFMAMADIALQKGGYIAKGKSIEQYEQDFAKGERSPQFLLAYMQQNSLAKKDNSTLADTLFAHLPESQRLQQPYIGYLALNVSTVASPLFGFLASQHEAVNKAINPGDQLFFESAMIGAARSLNGYKGPANPAIVQHMKDFHALLAPKKVMVESYYYGPLGRYFKSTKDAAGFLSMAKDYGQTIIFQTSKKELEKIDKDIQADVQAKLTSGEIDSAYFKAKTRNPYSNREQAAIRTSNLAFDVARLAQAKSDKEYAIRLIQHADALYPSSNSAIMRAAVQQLVGDNKGAEKTLKKALAANPKQKEDLLKRYESLTATK